MAKGITELVDDFKFLHPKAYERIYNKAIDDFIHECDKYCGFYSGKNKNLTREDLLKIAEQLKAGGKNA